MACARVTINPSKTVLMLFSITMSPSLVPTIYYGNIRLHQVQTHKHLGLILTPNLSWMKHISAAIAKPSRHFEVLKKILIYLFQKILRN